MRLNSFDAVVDWYNAVVPLVSKYHKEEDDIRPIGDRRRKWERIIKLSDTRYALSDGYYSTMIGHMYQVKEFEENMYPIVWERREDGDYIRIRSVGVSSTVHARLRFLGWNLPRGLGVTARNGRMFILQDGQEHYLPKTTHSYDYQNHIINEDDKMELWFKRVGEYKFERANKLLAQSTRVDIREKKRLKPYIQSFFGWAGIMHNMLHLDWNSQCTYYNQLESWARDNKALIGFNYVGLQSIKPSALRQIIVQEDHPMRVHFAVAMFSQVGLMDYHERTEIRNEQHAKEIKARFNRWITKALDLYKTEEI